VNFEEFFTEAKRLDVKLDFPTERPEISYLLSNEALFHLPLLAMIILMMSKGAKKPRSNELGQVVGDCIERTLAGFKGSSQHIGWSANLRIRTIKALAFLELADLVHVDQNAKLITATEKGKKVIALATDGDGNLATTLGVVERNYRDMAREQQLRLQAI
jgi:hypothetical protein